MFKFIWRYSSTQQLTALALTLVSFPFLYFSLDLPKTIINKAIDTEEGKFPAHLFAFDIDLFGFQFGWDGILMDQLPYLFTLCGIFLALVFINGGFKLRINTYKGVMAERLLRRMRYILLNRTLRFPLPEFRRTSQGEVVSMVAQEVEPLGGFFGDAYVLVAFQGGQFATIMAFMFAQDWRIGLAAFAMIPVQGYVIPKLQRKVNLLGKERVKHVRALSGRIGEVIGGVQDIHSQDTSRYILADMGHRLGKIFWIRFEIYQRKFFMKFVNNFMNQLTPFFFFSVGGYLVINGSLSVGALVAALAAYKDLAAPWKELLGYYNQMADATIKYEAVTSQFAPDRMLPEELQENPPEEIPRLNADIEAKSLSYIDEDGVKLLDAATFKLPVGSRTAILSNNGTAKEAATAVLGRLMMPTSGKIHVGDFDLAHLHEAVTGRRMAVLTGNSIFFNASIETNLFLGLQHLPPEKPSEDLESWERDLEEALATGNSPFPFNGDWTDYKAVGYENRADLMKHTAQLLERFELDEELYTLGLRQQIEPKKHPDMVEKLLKARHRMREVLDERGIEDLVQSYDYELFNTYSTIAENVLFGKPAADEFRKENMGANPIILGLLDELDMRPRFLDIGMRCAELMLELFQGLPPGHPFFEQYSFVDEELLPEFKTILRHAKQDGVDSLNDEERDLVMSLPFKLIPQRHRLGLVDDELRETVVKMRHMLHEKHPELFGTKIRKFDPDGYNNGVSILDNVLFGRIVHGRADATDKILEAMVGIVAELGLWEDILTAAFEFPVGIGGTRLSAMQRQKIAVVRTILTKPDICIVNEAFGALDTEAQGRIVSRLFAELPDTTFVWVDSAPASDIDFDQVFELANGRLTPLHGEAAETAAAPPPEAAEAEESVDTSAALGAETKFLRELPLFANLDSSKLRLLAFTSDRKTYEPGEVMVKQGDQGDAAFVVLDGEAEVVLEGANGEETILYVMKRGQVLGELAMLCDTPRSATVRARTALTALRLNRDVFVELARQDPYFSFEMTRDLGQRLLKTTAELNSRK